METARTCAVCPKPLPPERVKRRAKYCSTWCAKTSERAAYAKLNVATPGLTSNTVGAMSEMLVAVDLLRRGFSVFRSLSPSCKCDLVAMNAAGKVLRVEVKTAFRWASGKRCAPSPANDLFDVMAYAYKTGEIEYEPPLLLAPFVSKR